MVFIGDLYQLPPVLTSAEKPVFMERYKSPYFFDAFVMTDGAFDMDFVEFENIYRQRDNAFIGLLNKIRNNSVEQNDIELLNERLIGKVLPVRKESGEDFSITLTTTNASAETMNSERLGNLPGLHRTFDGYTEGHFDTKNLPTELHLMLKLGAQVMFVANDTRGRWVNGTIGRIAGFKKDEEGEDFLEVTKDDGETVNVTPFEWEMYEYAQDDITGVPTMKVAGTFTQFPLKLAWAITIHKSQ